MARFIILYSNRNSTKEITSFDTLAEAEAYCNDQVKGYEPSTGNETDRCDSFRYEVYDTSNFDEVTGCGNPVFTTDLFWEE